MKKDSGVTSTVLKSRFSGKRVLIMGLGVHGGGLEAAKFFLRVGARVTITDRRSAKDLSKSLSVLRSFLKGSPYPRVRLRLGTHDMDDFTHAEVILKNPGVRPDSPYLVAARKRGIPVISDISLFFELSPAPIIGITGTRGKSTTAYLLAEFLKHARGGLRRVWLGGNIRKSVFEFLPRIRKNDRVVLELSSFQLMDIARVKKSPQIAVITNLLNDHLNWHRSAEEYAYAKSLLFRFQGSSDHLFMPARDRVLAKLTRGAKAHIHTTVLSPEYQRIVSKTIGAHYESSVGLAIAVARMHGVPHRAIKKVLARFRGLPSRQEEIRTWRGIHFVNDTTATIPDAVVVALRRFAEISKKRGGGLVLIAGGSDKKLEFIPLAQEIHAHAKYVVFLPGDATGRMKRVLTRTGFKRFSEARSMDEAVRFALRRARAGDTILLSPGAASFGLFLNEFDRGDAFERAVKRFG